MVFRMIGGCACVRAENVYVRTVRGARALRVSEGTRICGADACWESSECTEGRQGVCGLVWARRARSARIDCVSYSRTWVARSVCASSVPWLCPCACSAEWFRLWVHGWRTRLSEWCERAASHALTTGRDLLQVVWRVSEQHVEPRVAMQVVVAACPA